MSFVPTNASTSRQPHQVDVHYLEATYPIAQLAEGLTIMWDNGWHPFDVSRVIDNGSTAAHAAVIDALSLNRQGWHPRAAKLWTQQADALGAISPWWQVTTPYWQQFLDRHDVSADRLAWQLKLVVMMFRDPPVQPRFEASPTEPSWVQGSPGADHTVLGKVRGLLAKAESTTFDHEAEALSAKAQELIARHSIDVALLADTVDVPGGKRVYIDAPYAKAKYLLLSAIGDANGCRCVWNGQRDTATIIGHQGDLHLTEVLFTSLLVQATGAILSAGSQLDSRGSSRTRAWRNAFWQGYAYRIGQRLAVATESTRVSYQGALADLLPVLAQREQAVEDAVAEAFPRLGTLRTSVSSGDGLHAGRRFGDQAQLGHANTVPKTGNRRLTP